MIVILPTGTGFIVGTVGEKPLVRREKMRKRAEHAPLAKYWTEVRQWMRAAVPAIH